MLSMLFFATSTEAKTTMHQYTLQDISGKELKLESFKGKVVLVTNIATRCGYTPQLKGLQEIYEAHKDKGFVVLGVPSDQFGGQTPEEEAGVASFCEKNYGVTFPLTEKTQVKGSDKDPLFAYLIQNTGGDEIGWNFEKFVVGKDGKVITRFGSSTKPSDEQLTQAIQDAL